MSSPPLVLKRLRGLGVTDLLFAQVYPIVSSVLITFVTARTLGPQGRGSLAFVTATCTLVAAVLFLSLHVGASELHTRGLPGLRAALHIVLTLDLGLIMAGAIAHAGGIINTEDLVLVAGSALVALNLVVLRCVQAIGDNSDFRRSWAIQSLGYAVIGIPVAILTRDWRWVTACWALALIASTLYSARAFRREAVTGPITPRDYARTLRPSVMAHVGSMGMQVLYRADLVVLGVVSTKSEVGYYSIAVTATGFVWNIAEAFSLRAFQRSADDTRPRDDARLLYVNSLVSLAVGISICVVSAALVPLLLPGYEPSVMLILVLTIGVVVQGPARVAMAALQREQHYGSVMRVGIAALIMSLAYVPVAMRYHATGLAWASTLAYCILAAVVLLIWRRVMAAQPSSRTGKRASA